VLRVGHPAPNDLDEHAALLLSGVDPETRP
jgi:hypothetical protein